MTPNAGSSEAHQPTRSSALRCLRCPECSQSYPALELQTYCPDCESPLLAVYDLDQVRDQVQPEDLLSRSGGLWRWRELLPLFDPACRFSLGEGGTPLLHASTFGKQLELPDLHLKDEGVNPTGTFKARGLAVAVAKALELGARGFVIPTAGNAGGALAAYAARAGVPAHVFMPADAPRIHQTEVRMAGADLHLVEGLIDRAGQEAAQLAEERGFFNVATFREPYRVEGKKTMGFELAEDLQWSLPDVIVYPTGGGTGLVGMWKAFDELEALGWVGADRPRMISVQIEGCAPVVRAIEQGAERIAPWPEPRGRASGLRVPGLFADRLVLRVLRESGGSALAVTEDQVLEAQRRLGSSEGILACFEGAATLAGLQRLLDGGAVGHDERVVLFNTGTGLKDERT